MQFLARASLYDQTPPMPSAIYSGRDHCPLVKKHHTQIRITLLKDSGVCKGFDRVVQHENCYQGIALREANDAVAGTIVFDEVYQPGVRCANMSD